MSCLLGVMFKRKMLKIVSLRKWFMPLFVFCVCGTLLLGFSSIQTPQLNNVETIDQRPIGANVSFDAMVLTYMRSGSSFVGQVIGFREDSFYWYEPLRKLHTWEYMSSNGAWCNYRNNTCRTASGIYFI